MRDADLGAVATMYSQLAGVLAGFAFAGVVVIVSGSLGGSASDGRQAFVLREALATMVCSFFGLALAALTYAAMGADANRPGSLAAEHLFAGVQFLIAGQFSVFSVLALIQASIGGDVFYYANRLLSQFSAIPMFALLCLGVDLYCDIRYPQGGPDWISVCIVLLIALLTVWGAFGYLSYGWVATRRLHVASWTAISRLYVERRKSLLAIAASGLFIMTSCTLAVCFLVAHDASARWTPPLAVAVVMLLVGFLGAATLPIYLYLTRIQPQPFARGDRVALAADKHYLTGNIEEGAPGTVTAIHGSAAYHVRYTVQFDHRDAKTTRLYAHDLVRLPDDPA
ncbi:hypothetical protein [Cryptosporangium aurantiacum]|uniref:Uncharacterized protein n=1 Tax=Cryptosporangium aurantiacum TaxID=134849 RepID=A0A1M7HTH2_9ACTN|nr:hypothetical protein [Cryptosporangium aurantiacum]SHM31842.1 hypothetical protein SAMN05443668_101288 [Cryptosporangium aurantiacum]